MGPGPARKSGSREPILHHNLGQGELAALRHGGFHGLANGDHEADHVVVRQVDDLGDLHRVEADHRARVVAHGLGCEHDRLPRDPA